MRNVGFVKVEKNGAQSMIHIHGKGLRMTGGDSLRVWLLFEEEGQIFGVPQGEIAYMGPALNYRLTYTDEDTGEPEHYEDVEGILLESTRGRKFAALWDDDIVSIENVKPWSGRAQKREEIEMPEEAREMPDEILDEMQDEMRQEQYETPGAGMAEPEMVMPEMTTPNGTMPNEVRPDNMPSDESAPNASIMNTPYNPLEEISPDNPNDEREIEVQQNRQKISSQRKVTKIQRGEISMLPRCEWRLANNNFLLHGYYNYRHLVLIDDGRILKLGVPGIYHEKEARAAAGLGFPEFISAEDTNLSLTPEECNEEERFGYWCRQVRRPVM